MGEPRGCAAAVCDGLGIASALARRAGRDAIQLFRGRQIQRISDLRRRRIERRVHLDLRQHLLVAPGAKDGHAAALVAGVQPVAGERRLRAAQRSRLLALTGLPEGAELRVPRDADLGPVAIPQEGLALSRRLAERLGVRAGDSVQVEVLEGARRVHDLPVAALVEDIIGFTALMEIGALNRLMREGDLVSHVAMRVDPLAAEALKLTAPDLVELGVIDEIVKEPIGGAQTDPVEATRLLDEALRRALAEAAAIDVDTRLEQRYQKFRKMGSVGLVDEQGR